jgi:hypothetical protein
VDGATDTVEIPAPVGKPVVSATKKPPRRKGKIIELDPTTKLQKKAQAPAGNAQDSAQPLIPRK